MLDFIRLGCAVPHVRVADVKKNVEDICEKISEAEEKGVDLLVFPELGLTGYTCGDLFFQQTLQTAVKTGLNQLAEYSADYPKITTVIGLPVTVEGLLYNCAAVISGGVVRGIVPKTFIPDHKEFNEKRWFAASSDLRTDSMEAAELGLVGDYTIPVGADLLFRVGDATVGVEICEDLWAPIAPSVLLSLGGAEIIVNLAASNETVCKRNYRRDMVVQQSASCGCIYAFCSAGATESTQDMVFSGHSVIAQGGKLLAENEKTVDTDYLMVHDADLEVVRGNRMGNTSFRDAITFYEPQTTVCMGNENALRGDGRLYPVRKSPFVPETPQERIDRCLSVFEIQVAGLKQRLATIGTNAVVGISGGLDSTLALLVAVAAIKQLGRPVTDVYGITMPCFGTSDRTYQNALTLMKTLGISTKEIPIRDAVNTHFRDIGHDPAVHNTTYENAQARERTQILMDYAGEVGGIVVGTGDLSELALGWCTYNGDHMSMYGVNGSVPKTLIPWMIEAIAGRPDFASAREVLMDIVDTPISPELLPPDAQGKISQQTEDIVGPYALHDFFLYYMLRYGYSPKKIYTLACRAFEGDYDAATIGKWLQNFYRRFFSQQFKRNCQPDGIKVGSVSLSPRGDFKMPSDAAAKLWLEEADSL